MDLNKIFARDARITSVVVYHDGFVPNRYKWPAPGRKTVHLRDGTSVDGRYDRKRSYGHGPHWVAMSERGGRLDSGY